MASHTLAIRHTRHDPVVCCIECKAMKPIACQVAVYLSHLAKKKLVHHMVSYVSLDSCVLMLAMASVGRAVLRDCLSLLSAMRYPARYGSSAFHFDPLFFPYVHLDPLFITADKTEAHLLELDIIPALTSNPDKNVVVSLPADCPSSRYPPSPRDRPVVQCTSIPQRPNRTRISTTMVHPAPSRSGRYASRSDPDWMVETGRQGVPRVSLA